jgi:hypothetical protein
MLHGNWLVKFGLANAEEVRPYRSAALLRFDPSSDALTVVVLSKDPWPAT